MIHDFKLHVIQELTNQFIANNPQHESKRNRIQSHLISSLNTDKSILNKINSLKTLTESDITTLNEYTTELIKTNLHALNHERINKTVENFKLPDHEFNAFLASQTMHDLLEVSTKEELTPEDIKMVYSKFKEASHLATKNYLKLKKFCAKHDVSAETNFHLEHHLKFLIDPNIVAGALMQQELSNGDITRCYNYIMINNAIDHYKSSHPTLFPKYQPKDYFAEEDPLVLERAFHPHIHWHVIDGKKAIQPNEAKALSENGIQIADIERKIEGLRNQDPSTFWSPGEK